MQILVQEDTPSATAGRVMEQAEKASKLFESERAASSMPGGIKGSSKLVANVGG